MYLLNKIKKYLGHAHLIQQVRGPVRIRCHLQNKELGFNKFYKAVVIV